SSRRMSMSASLPIGRRHFLASAAISAIGVCLPLTSAHAATSPPTPPGAETSAPAQPAPTTTASLAESAVVGTGAAAEQSGDTSIRPFKYHASDAELADLKRRIKETRWPERENDPKQGVNL